MKVFIRTRISRITRILFAAGRSQGTWTRDYFEHELNKLNEYYLHAEARSAMLTFECWMLNCCVWPQCGIAQWWISMLTWWLLNENDTNEINTDSTRSFVITHCLCSVLKVESLYSFSPTIGKQAFIVIHYRKGAKASLLYIIQCLKFNSEETSL